MVLDEIENNGAPGLRFDKIATQIGHVHRVVAPSRRPEFDRNL